MLLSFLLRNSRLIQMIDYSNIPRDSRRVPLETRVQFKFDRFSGFISEYSANISPGGLFLRTKSPRPPGTVLDFEFRLGDGFELIKGRGEVIWVRAEDEGPARPAGMGLRFLELSEGSRELIYRIVDHHVLQGGTPFDVTQRPPDPMPVAVPDVVRSPLPDLFDAPPAPPPAVRSEREALPEATSWLPRTDLAGSALSSIAEPLPEPLPPSAAPAPVAPQMFASILGSGTPQRPRRVLPWAVLAGGVVLVAAGFLLRGRLMEWLGRGEAARASATAPAVRPATKATSPQPGPAGLPERSPSQASATPAAGAPAPSPTATVAAPPPAPSPAGQQQAAGPALTRLDRITWERAAGGTDVFLWGNGAMPASIYKQTRLEGNPPRELIRLEGVRSPQPLSRVVVGTAEILQIRLGYHPEAGKGELHVVLDLAHPNVAVTQIEPGPRRLRIHLQRR